MPGVKDWIVKASVDLKSAKKLIRDDDDTLESAAYFTQQSAEKALKAYFIFKQQSIPRTHDIEKLLLGCIKLDSTFGVLREAAETLSPYATYTRYPDDRFHVDREEVMEAIKYAEKTLKFVNAKIEPGLRSLQQELF